MNEILLIILAYMIGSIPTSVIISKSQFNIDIRDYGSGNAGATNTFRVLGSKWGSIVMILDMLKGLVAVKLALLLPYYMTNEFERTNFQIGLGLAAVIGHIFPVWADFRGGKGVATLFGLIIAISPLTALSCVTIFLAVLYLTRFVSLSSIMASMAFPVFILIIFNVDNGAETLHVNWMRQDYGHDPSGGWRGMKRDAWEGGHRVPFIVRWPGVFQAGLISDQMINTTDIFATVASIVGFKLKDADARDSYDMLPAMLGTQVVKRSIRPHLLTQNFRGEFQVRQGNWKYINHKGSGGNNYEVGFLKTYALPETADDAPGQLYNLLHDPGETTNLYFKEAEKRKGLQDLLEELKSSGRSAPLNRQPIGIERVRALGKQNIQKQQAIPE